METLKNGFKFIEQKRNIIYFSQYSFEVSEFQRIYNFVQSIKENTFISVYSYGKELVNNYIDFLCITDNNQNDTKKVFIICSLLFLHYYSLFGYETDNSFNQFYINELALLSDKFQIFIKDENKFKEFANIFYNSLQYQIKNHNYDNIKLLYSYYNPYILNDNNNSQKQNILDNSIFNNILNIKNKKRKKFNTNILSAKERIVDLVLDIKKENLSSNHSNSDTNNTSFYSKRLLSELTKCEIKEEMKKLIDDISAKIEDNYLDNLLNTKKNCYLTTVSYFLCYLIEINSDMIREIPEFKNIKEDITLRFMVTAKNIYHISYEIYFSLFDLSYTNFDTFVYILKKIKIPEKYYYYIIYFCKKFSIEMKKYGENCMKFIDDILNNVNQEFINLWETNVVEMGKNFSSYCLV